MVTIAIDACFRLKRRDVSNVEKDPILGSGWGYFVEDAGYHELLRSYGDQDEVSPDSDYDSLNRSSIPRCRHVRVSRPWTMRIASFREDTLQQVSVE